MADVAALASKVPTAWQRALLPFIQRSAEFEQVKQPLVGFFLLQYVAHVGMKLHKQHANKAESTPFIMALLDVLEAKKALYAAEIAEADGRTEISRAALALFSRADDDERRGVVSEAIVKLFYSSSLLFEATKQFMDDDTMDPFAAEKHKYAQVVAMRMKKALASGTPYESPSGAKERVEGVADVDGGAHGGSGSSSAAVASPPTMPPPPPAAAPPAANGYSYTPPAPAPAPANNGYSYTPPAAPAPAAANNGYSYQPPAAPTPAPAAPAPAAAANSYSYQPPAAPPQQQMPPPPQHSPAPMSSPQPMAPVNTYVPPSAPPGAYNPTPNDMIDSQKYAKLAVSALQFYDHQNARKQLLLALQYLDGQVQK